MPPRSWTAILCKSNWCFSINPFICKSITQGWDINSLEQSTESGAQRISMEDNIIIEIGIIPRKRKQTGTSRGNVRLLFAIRRDCTVTLWYIMSVSWSWLCLWNSSTLLYFLQKNKPVRTTLVPRTPKARSCPALCNQKNERPLNKKWQTFSRDRQARVKKGSVCMCKSRWLQHALKLSSSLWQWREAQQAS